MCLHWLLVIFIVILWLVWTFCLSKTLINCLSVICIKSKLKYSTLIFGYYFIVSYHKFSCIIWHCYLALIVTSQKSASILFSQNLILFLRPKSVYRYCMESFPAMNATIVINRAVPKEVSTVRQNTNSCIKYSAEYRCLQKKANENSWVIIMLYSNTDQKFKLRHRVWHYW